jgi:hypothetical protein
MTNLYRIALTEAGLEKGFLFSLGISRPSNQFKAYSTQLPQGNGGQKRLGYQNDVWQWIAVTPTQVNEICEIVEAALAGNGVIYVTMPRANGQNAGLDWVDAYGIPIYPEIVQIQDANVNGRVIQSVTMPINNITIVNEVSTAVPA